MTCGTPRPQRSREAMSKAQSDLPDVVIADLAMPAGGGIETVRGIRRWWSMPIIVLSARADESDKVEALNAGADDYVHVNAETQTPFEVRDLHVDLVKRKVTVRGSDLHLTEIEYLLLAALIEKAGQVFTYAELLRHASSPRGLDRRRDLRINMAGLHRKLEVNSAQPDYLLSEIAVGYRLVNE